MDKTGQIKRNKKCHIHKNTIVFMLVSFSESLKVHNTEFERVSCSFESVCKKKFVFCFHIKKMEQ